MAHDFSLTLSHVGYFVTDIAKMVDFYTRFLKFVVSDRGDRDDGGAIVFMTRDPREHHQLVFATGKPADLAFNVVNQISFRVDSLATLREMFHGLKHEAITLLGPHHPWQCAVGVFSRSRKKSRRIADRYALVRAAATSSGG